MEDRNETVIAVRGPSIVPSNISPPPSGSKRFELVSRRIWKAGQKTPRNRNPGIVIIHLTE